MKKLITLWAVALSITAVAQSTFDIPGATGTYVTGINDSAYICGYFLKDGAYSGFFYNGVDTVIVNQATTGYVNNYFGGINNKGYIIGYQNTGATADNVAFLYNWRTQFISPESTPAGYHSVVVSDIDDSLNISGQISSGSDRRIFAKGITEPEFAIHYSSLGGTVYPTYGGGGHLPTGYTTGYYIDGVERWGFVYYSGVTVLSRYTWLGLTSGGLVKTIPMGINEHMHVLVEVGGTKGYICTDIDDPAANLVPIIIPNSTAVHPDDINNSG